MRLSARMQGLKGLLCSRVAERASIIIVVSKRMSEVERRGVYLVDERKLDGLDELDGLVGDD
jgi:hypothetical protein